jgi:hypothetical protein
MLSIRCYLTIGAAFLGMAATAVAQEFRIYTSVSEITTTGRTKSRPASHGLMLFHAGKVYDYLEESQETMIHDPAHNRFLVLSKPHDLVTEISQDEVRQFLEVAHKKTREMIFEWQRTGKAKASAIAAMEFQLLPQFEVRHDVPARMLTLSSPILRYDVKYDKAPSAEILQTYLRTVDWTAQLNSVLGPQAMLPEPRLRLNEELRQLGVLPLEVELRIEGDRPVHLRAKHEWTWELNQTDRTYIDHWESELRRPEAQRIAFREFQQKTLVSDARKR